MLKPLSWHRPRYHGNTSLSESSTIRNKQQRAELTRRRFFVDGSRPFREATGTRRNFSWASPSCCYRGAPDDRWRRLRQRRRSLVACQCCHSRKPCDEMWEGTRVSRHVVKRFGSAQWFWTAVPRTTSRAQASFVRFPAVFQLNLGYFV